MSITHGTSASPIRVGSRRELFVDRFLIQETKGTQLKLHTPEQTALAEQPLPSSYTTLIKDGDLFRGYYRSSIGDVAYDGHPNEFTCYAESRDGIDWNKPTLGLFQISGSRDNNVIWAHDPPRSHNFSPLLDTRPGVPLDERFKALAGTHKYDRGRPPEAPPLPESDSGLVAFASGDGIHWRKLQDEPVIKSQIHAFDSQNVSFWSETEGCYVCYYRSWLRNSKFEPDEIDGAPFRDFVKYHQRSISRTTSADFIHWGEPIPMDPNAPGEHLYTSQTHPYFRAPHIYIATPTRFMPERGGSTDVMFMTSRGGDTFDRTFMQACIRPGLDPTRWGNRANYAALNVVPTGPAEMSIYVKGHRYVVRTDGFSSVNAGYDSGEMLTNPLVFSGRSLEINYSTSAAGAVGVEIQDVDGSPVPGFELDECLDIIGDEIERTVSWKNGVDASALAGIPIRLRFVMKDADLFALRFV